MRGSCRSAQGEGREHAPREPNHQRASLHAVQQRARPWQPEPFSPPLKTLFAFCSGRSRTRRSPRSTGRATRTSRPPPTTTSLPRRRERSPTSARGRSLVEPGEDEAAVCARGRLGDALGATNQRFRRLLARSGWFPCGTSTATSSGPATVKGQLDAGSGWVPCEPSTATSSGRLRRPTRCRAPRDERGARGAHEPPGQAQLVRALAHLGTGRPRRVPGVVPATGPAEPASAPASQERSERRTTMGDHVDVPFSQGTAGCSPTSLCQPPAGPSAMVSERKEQQSPPRAREPPGRGERKALNRVPPPPTRAPSRSECPARLSQPQTSRSQRWATSLRAWPATNQPRRVSGVAWQPAASRNQRRVECRLRTRPPGARSGLRAGRWVPEQTAHRDSGFGPL